jgi:RNA polymerase sigma-70 factor (ECF subfamily)
MGIHPNEISTDALLAQAGWLTALARRLVRDPSEADDVAQETLMTALSSEVPPQRPWLARVARNVARMRARSETARVHREGSRGPAAPAPSAADLAEKLEAQRLLVEAVRDLGEPYRATILLHYWEHKTSEEIAAIQGVPAGTVRWRLKWGVDALRERLDARHRGDRRAWSAMLAPLTAPAAAGTVATTSLLGGLFGMKLLLQGAVAAVVLAAVGAGVWLAQRETSLDAAPVLSNERAPVVLEDAAAPAEAPASMEEPQSVAREPAEAKVPARAEAAPTPRSRIEARILDEERRPLRGAVLELTGEKGIPLGVADGEGRIACSLDRISKSFRVSAAGHATRILSANMDEGRTTYLGDVVLQPGGSVSGRILDENKKPIAGATVGLDKMEMPAHELRARGEVRHVEEPRTQSLDDGTFRIDGAPVALCRVVAFSPEHEVGLSDIVEVRAAQVTSGVELELAPLSPERIVRGIVLDPDGKPVPAAEIAFQFAVRNEQGSSTESGRLKSDQDGRFHRIVRAGSKVDLVASDPKQRWSDAAAMGLRASAEDIVLQFGRVPLVEIVVTSAEGRPVEKWTGSFLAADRSRQLLSIPGIEHAGGIARVPVPSDAFVVAVNARGFARAEVGPIEPAAVGDRLSVVMQPVPSIAGRVVSAAGPVAGAEVSLFRQTDQRIEHNGFLVAVEPSPRDETSSGEDGTFELTPKEGGLLIVRAEKKPWAPTEIVLRNVDVNRGAGGLEIMLSEGGTIEGRVLPLPGRDPAGTIVAISRGDPFSRTQRVGPDGAYRFEHLMPGRWNVTSVDEEIDPHSSSSTWNGDERPEMPWNCEVLEGKTTRFDLGRDAPAPCVLLGQLDVRGAERGVWNAALAGAHRDPKIVTLDDAGAFRLERAQPGEMTLLLTAITGPLEGTRLMAEVDFVVGEARFSHEVSTAKLVVRGAGSGSKAPLALIVVRDRTLLVRPLPDEGDVEVTVPAGKGRIMRLDPEVLTDPDPTRWVGGVEVEIAAGQTASVDRP